MVSTFTEEIPTNTQIFFNADYPSGLVNNVIRQINEKYNNNTQDNYIIWQDFFDIPKPFLLAEILYCSRKETLSKCFIIKFHEHSTNLYSIHKKIYGSDNQFYIYIVLSIL